MAVDETTARLLLESWLWRWAAMALEADGDLCGAAVAWRELSRTDEAVESLLRESGVVR